MALRSKDIANHSRRAALGVLGAGALGFALFGPRGARERSDGRVVLNYWEKWTGHEARVMRELVNEFNASQNRSFVRYFSMSAIDQKAKIAIAGGDPPDILGLWNFSIPAFSEANALMPLDDLARPAKLTPDHYAPPVWRMMTYQGRLWGLVSTCSTIALYYSRAAFVDAGLDPDRPPRTIDQLDEAAQKLTTKAGSSADRFGFLHTEPGWWDWLWGYHFGGCLYDEVNDRATTTAPENIDAYRWVQSYPQRYGASRLVSFQSGFGNYFSLQQPFLAGKVAMTLHGPFLANVINQFRPGFDYGAAPFPVRDHLLDESDPIGMLECDILCVPRGTKYPREAFEFIAFTQSRRVMERLATVHAKPTPLATSSPRFVADHPNRCVEVHNRLVRSRNAFVVPRTRVWPQYQDDFRTSMQRLWTLQDSPGNILAGIERRIQGELDRAAEMRRRRTGSEP